MDVSSGMPVLASPLRVRDGRPGGRTGRAAIDPIGRTGRAAIDPIGRTGRAAIDPIGRTGRVASLVADGQDGYTYIWDG